MFFKKIFQFFGVPCQVNPPKTADIAESQFTGLAIDGFVHGPRPEGRFQIKTKVNMVSGNATRAIRTTPPQEGELSGHAKMRNQGRAFRVLNFPVQPLLFRQMQDEPFGPSPDLNKGAALQFRIPPLVPWKTQLFSTPPDFLNGFTQHQGLQIPGNRFNLG